MKSTINTAVELDENIESAEKKVDELSHLMDVNTGSLTDKLESLSGESERRLFFNPIADFKNIYENLKKAREKTHELVSNYKSGEDMANKFKTGYDTVLNLKNSLGSW